MKTIYFSVIMLFLLLIQFSSIAQKKIKWGRLAEEEIGLTSFQDDHEASAVILSDVGHVTFISGNVNIERHTRIKILSQNGFKWADLKIPFYSNDDFEMLHSAKAQTINIVDNKTINSKAKDDYVVKVDENWSELRITFPDIKVGSIVEYRYTITSKNVFFLDPWNFQSEIPTLYSDLVVEIPDHLEYNVLLTGKELTKKYFGQSTNHWFLSNLPAIKDEPFVDSPKNYSEKLQFQLNSYKRLNNVVSATIETVLVSSSWAKIRAELLEHVVIRSYTNKKGDLLEIVNEIRASSKNQNDIIKSAYQYVVKNYTWNSLYSRFPDKDINGLLKDKSGNSASINLLLYRILKLANVNASPVLISTRSHGHIYKQMPFRNQFNNIIVHIKTTDGKNRFIDAKTGIWSCYMPDMNDNNVEGLVLNNDDNDRWISIKTEVESGITSFTKINLSQGILSYDMQIVIKGFNAGYHRSKFKEIELRQIILDNMKNGDYIFEDVNIEIINFSNPNEDIKLSVNAKTMLDDEFILIKPLLLNSLIKNPFTSDTRNYPINLTFLPKDKHTVLINFEGYSVEELPQNQIVTLEGDIGKQNIYFRNTEEFIQVTSAFEINKNSFHTSSYQELKGFYGHYENQLSTALVLKKTN